MDRWLGLFKQSESAEENVEQDDSMEKADVNNESNTYVSCYPNTRRYSLASTMSASQKPLFRVDNQGYSVDMGCSDDEENKKKNADTKINIPSGQPPQYSAVHEKMLDKKVKVCIW